MVVEDDPALRSQLRSRLEDAQGMNVVECATARMAMTYLAEAPCDLVCLDLMLPDASGFEICELIRKQSRNKDVPILVVSARSLPADRARAEEAGASAYLIKPFRGVDFMAQVVLLVGERQRDSGEAA